MTSYPLALSRASESVRIAASDLSDKKMRGGLSSLDLKASFRQTVSPVLARLGSGSGLCERWRSIPFRLFRFAPRVALW